MLGLDVTGDYKEAGQTWLRVVIHVKTRGFWEGR